MPALLASGGKRVSPARRAAAIVPLLSISQMQLCDVWPIPIRSPKVFQALKSAEHLGGNDGGNSLSFRSLFTLKFDSRRLHHRTSTDIGGPPQIFEDTLKQQRVSVSSIPSHGIELEFANVPTSSTRRALSTQMLSSTFMDLPRRLDPRTASHVMTARPTAEDVRTHPAWD